MPKKAPRIVTVLKSFYPPSFKASGIRRLLIPILLLMILPLALSTFQSDPSLTDRILRTIAAHPEDPGLRDRIVKAQEHTLTYDQLLALFPGKRLDGAMLPRDSNMHWLFGLGSVGLFLALTSIVIPRTTRLPRLVIILVFTATAGILFIICCQAFTASAADSDRWVISVGPSELMFLFMKFVGYSYSAGDNPDNGFILSFLGFTFGVGLCEEVAKAIPLLLLARKGGAKEIPCRKFLLWGLISGTGFGVAEGLQYSSSSYNGISGAADYCLRFLSCVALHAIWSGAVGVIISERLLWLREARRIWSYAFEVLLVVFAPMVLHGLYDTLLKENHDALALLAALASVLLLAYLIKLAYPRSVPVLEPAVLGSPAALAESHSAPP